MNNYDDGYRDGYNDAIIEYRDSAKTEIYELLERNKGLYTLNEQKLIYEVIDNLNSVLDCIFEKKKG